MKIALLAGSFNPIHRAHVALGRWVLDAQLVEEVWYVVSPANPLKRAAELADFEHRVAMARLSVESIHGMRVVDIEGVMPRPSYTINTILALQELYPEHTFFLLCGSDIVDQLPRWHRIDELRGLVEFVVYPRSTTEADDGGGGATHTYEPLVCSGCMMGAPVMDVDATSIRQMVGDFYCTGSSKSTDSTALIETTLSTQLDPRVLDYIIKNNLYKNDNNDQ